MTDDPTPAPSRREYVRYGGAIVGGSLLAGCPDADGAGSTPAEGDGSGANGQGSGMEDPGSDDPGSGDGSADGSDAYAVTMSPMGTVEFASVPERIYTGLPNTADMAVAAGQADAVEAVYYPEYHGTLLNHFYERLDGVSLEWDGLTDAWNLGKEGFYELDCDVHLTDPAYASALDALGPDDVTEIREQIAPWFGNYYSDRHRDPPEGWADGYEHYSLWEIFRKVAAVFRAGDRADALADVHTSTVSAIQSKLPPADERPSVGLVFPGEDDTLWIYRLNAEGFLTAHTRPLGATDAFADEAFDGAQKQVDYEAVLDADPDVLLVLFTVTPNYSIESVREGLSSDPVASEVAAVQNDRMYAQGARYQGPILNLFQLEMTAKQLFPEQFGEWPGYVDGEPYPEIPENERLFDRQRVADVVTGAV